MKKNLFILLLMLFVLPYGVNAEEFYFNHSEYRHTTEPLEEAKDLEVIEILSDGQTLYKYRTRDYLIIPDPLIIYSKNFDILSTFDTNLPLEEIELRPQYDLEYMNHCHSHLQILYKDTFISKSVYISIDNYIKIPEEILVDNKDFDIWNYIETDIMDRENIEFIGEYNLDNNGEYEIEIKYNYITEKTKIMVDILENEKNNTQEENKDIVNNDEIIAKEEPTIEEDIIKNETINTYVNNYYELKETDKKIEYIEKIVPITNEIVYEKNAINDLFYYITYTFYGITIILLSIIVVRKK